MQHRHLARLVWLLPATACLAAGFDLTPAAAETLEAAIATALQSSPVIAARREEVAAARENLNAAFAGFFPKLVLSGTAGLGNQPVTALSSPVSSLPAAATLDQRTLGYGAELDQPLFDGLRTVNTVEEARQAAAAEEKDLMALRLQVQLDVARYYMAVVTGRSSVTLFKQAAAMLESDLALSRKQVERGEATRTDLEQTTLRLADTRGNLAAAQAALAASEASYEQVIGSVPAALVPPTAPDATLPASLEQGLSVALQANPSVLAALCRERSARSTVGKAEADFLPQVGLRAAYSRTYSQPAVITDGGDAQLTVQVTLPISVGGETLARVRQARAVLRQRLQETAARKAEIRALLRSSWAKLVAARQRVKLNRTAVEASEQALAGIRAQRKVGERTTLDVLNAQRDLIEIRQQQLQSRGDLLVAAYEILADTGVIGTTP